MAKKKENGSSNFLSKELWGMIITLFSLFIVFFLFSGGSIFYPFGLYVQTFMLGVFGFFAYPLFTFVFVMGIMLTIGKKITNAKSVLNSVLVALVLCMAFSIVHLATSPIVGGFSEYVSSAYNSASNGVFSSTFGGAFFAMIVFGLSKLLSVFGAYVAFSIVIVFCSIMLFSDKIFARASMVDKDRGDNTKIEQPVESPVREERVENPHYTFVNSQPFQPYFGGTRKNEKVLVAGGGEFEMKTYESFETPKTEKRESSILYTEPDENSVYSDEFNRSLREKAKFVKSPHKITPENADVKRGVPTSESSGDSSYYGRYDEVEEEEFTEEVYVPEGYKKAMQEELKGANKLEVQEDTFSEQEDFSSYNDVQDDYEGCQDFGDEIDVSDDSFDEEEFQEEEEPVKTEYKRPTPRKTEAIVPDERPSSATFKKVETAKPSSEGETNNGEDMSSNPYDNVPNNLKYNAPPIDLLKPYASSEDPDQLSFFKSEKATTIIKTLRVLGGFEVQIANIVHGPTVTRFDISIPDNVSIKNVVKYADDLKLRLAVATDIRISSIPGTSNIGIEIPNVQGSIVALRDIILSNEFKNAKKDSLTFAIGKNIIGKPVVADICKMPHLLVAGATGTGKSVGLNSLLISLMYKYSPQELRFIIVDPKQVEFAAFEGIPHMMFNEIIYDAPKAVAMLNWAVKEMESRYTLLRKAVVHNIDEYNAQIDPRKDKKLPRIVIIIDEFADLMSTDKKSIEEKIARIAQKARAAGIYLILATQRPSVNIMEGSIKTNFTSRIAFKMSNAIDSTTILGEAGAEKLLGKGDLLYRTSSMPNVERAQGAYIEIGEIKQVVAYIKEHNECYFNEAAIQSINNELSPQIENVDGKESDATNGKVPVDYVSALKYVVESKMVSISGIQRRFSFGFPKAAKIFDWMVREGYVLNSQNSKQKQVILTMEEFEELYGDYNV